MKKFFFSPLLLGALLCACLVATTHAQTEDEVKEALVKSVTLMQQGKHVEAIPHLELLVKVVPDEGQLRMMYGVALLTRSKQVDTGEQAKKTSAAALEQLQEAKQLGVKDPQLDSLIKLLGGSPISTEAEKAKLSPAEKYMQEAEVFFAQSKYDEALALYQKALAADPKLYEAALFGGDAYVSKQDWDNAEKMYQKAIAIDPLRETAYRYSGTPFMKQKKYDQARDRYVDAFIVEPYGNVSVRGLNQWAEVTGAKLGHPKIDRPKVDDSAKPDTGLSDAWKAYVATRAEWRKTKFAQAFPGEKAYRHSLKEESEALRAALKTSAESKNKEAAFDTLQKLESDGLLEAYILLGLADEGIAHDHAPYLKENRERLKQYVLRYVIQK